MTPKKRHQKTDFYDFRPITTEKLIFCVMNDFKVNPENPEGIIRSEGKKMNFNEFSKLKMRAK